MNEQEEEPGQEPEKKKEVISDPQEANFIGLRNILFDELNLLRSGKISIQRAKTVSQLSRRIIEAATLDLCAQGLIGEGSPKEIKRLMGNHVQD